ncbi:hypothetical protein HED60_00980 [Planctomycetales bacterium ZRK34]|nr:hypothetical protein HED60_00980 [Planctomycetales bacterium ZRK34]
MKVTHLSLIVLFAMFANTANAAFLGWTGDTFATDGTEDGTGIVLNASGGWTYEVAWNAGNGVDVTVNGVQFLNNPNDATDVKITLTGDNATGNENLTDEFPDGSAFETLMSSIEYNNAVSSNRSWTMRLEGLTPGQVYRVQFLAHQVTSTAASRDMQIYFGSDTSGPTTGLFNAGELPSSNSSYVQTTGDSWTALFSATGSAQDFFVGGANGEVPIINAVAVFSIPTPGALIGGVVLMGITVMRRRTY